MAKHPLADNYERRFRVELDKYHDGDSAYAEVDLGFGVSSHHLLRYLGLNAPEAHAVGGREATAFCGEWYLEHSAHVGKADNPLWPFRLRSERRDTEKYGRYLVIVTCAQGHSLNQALLDSGHAVPMNV